MAKLLLLINESGTARPYSRLSKQHELTYQRYKNYEDFKSLKVSDFQGRIVLIRLNSESNLPILLANIRQTRWLASLQVIVFGGKLDKDFRFMKNVLVLGKAVSATKLLAAIEMVQLIRSIDLPISDSNVERIIRSIEFPPEYYQSGITILSYFATLLRQKSLDENVKVAIEQNGLTVRLVIESPTGKREAIERTLEAYALVVTGKSDIGALSLDPFEALELRNQLRIAYVQLQAQRDVLELSKSEIANLRLDLGETKQALAIAQSRNSETADRFFSLLEGLTAQNSDLSRGMQKFTEQALAFQNATLVKAVEDVKIMLEQGVSEENANEFIQKIQIIQQQSPSLFHQISEFLLTSALSGSVGNAVYDCLRFIIGSLPK